MFFGGGDPFEHFGGGPGPARSREPVDNETYYRVLGVERECSNSEIKKAYRKLALKYVNMHDAPKRREVAAFCKSCEPAALATERPERSRTL